MSTSDPRFLSVAQVKAIHRASIERFGGTDGLRSRHLLESAVAQPQNVYFYGQGDLFEVAAAYAFHLAENQPFLDGNKRTAIGSALIFLRINGIDTMFDSMALYPTIIGIANSTHQRADLAAQLRDLCHNK